MSTPTLRFTRRAGSRPASSRRLATRLAIEWLEDRLAPATFTVVNTLNSGAGSLRQAILDANAHANVGGPDVIAFNMPATDSGHVYYRNDGVAGTVTLANVTATTAADDSTIADIDPDWAHSWWSITPTTPLTAVTEAAVVDGFTQAGATPNTLAVGNNAVLRVEVRGGGLSSNGFDLRGNSTVRGLAINRFTLSGAFAVALRFGGNNVVEGNFIGSDVSGTLDLGNGSSVIVTNAPGNRIGGTAPEARNVVSGNNTTGISLSSGDNNVVQGNYIGTNAAGTAALGNTSHGVLVGSANNTIGGTDPDSRNVISGNGQDGINVSGDNNLIQGNFIGTDATGTIDLGNVRFGIFVGGSGQSIGGTGLAARNVVSGNNNAGINVGGPNTIIQGNYIGTDVTGTQALGNGVVGILVPQAGTSTLIGGTDAGAGNLISANGNGITISGSAGVGQGATVQGNRIGTKADGVSPLGNTQHGVNIAISSTIPLVGNHVIGGTSPGAGNLIAFNQGDGVFVNMSFGNTILGNSISGNAGLGIDLNPNGVTPNDTGDADSGANLLQNNPVLTSAARSGGNAIIAGTLNGAANTTFRLEFFANIALDPTGFGEGQRYLGFHTVTTDAGGNVSFTATLAAAVSVGEFVTATATDPGNNTSEFSQGRMVESSNATPTANAGPDQAANERATVAFNGAGSSDPDGDALTYFWDFGDGTLGAGPTPTHVYADNGNYAVTLTVEDGKGGSSSDSLTVTVLNVDPAAVADSATTDEDLAVSIAVLANDSDVAAEFDPLQIIAVTNGSKGTTSIDTRGTPDTTDDEIVYTPNAGATGSDSFTYTINDGDDGTATATVTVQIRNLVDLSGRVFDDRDNDGTYEPGDGDVGLGGVSVQLVNETSTAVMATQTTAADGTYHFDVNLGAGTYKVVAAQPAGFLDGRETAGNLGGTVDNSQDGNQITALNVGAPGTTADAVDYLFADIRPSLAQGLVWTDSDNDGEVDYGETAIPAAAVELTGLDDRGQAVNRSTTTDANGIYAFVNLRPSNGAGYTIREFQPAAFVDGLDALGTVNGVAVGNGSVNDTFSAVVLPLPGSVAENYNFGEQLPSEGGVTAGQTATIGFWQNRNGQSLINALNGGSTSTQLANWLAATFPNMYGAGAGANDLTGKTNAQVAAFYKKLFARTAHAAAGGGPAKMDAQVLATAFAVYVTNQTLAGTTAASYGFLVSANGVGTRTFNVGGNGAAFGVADNSDVRVLDLLLAVNSRSRNGLLYDLDNDGDANDSQETSYRTMANNVFSALNEAGDI